MRVLRLRNKMSSASIKTRRSPKPANVVRAKLFEGVLMRPDDIPGELRYCLLVRESLREADTAATVGGPTTALHRMLDLAGRWIEEASALLDEFRHSALLV